MSDMIDKALETHEKRTETHACDLISRQAAIDALEWKWAGKAAMDAIKNLPSVESEQRWIPVSEKLPEDEYVLISKRPTKISGDKWSVAIAIRTADPRSGKIQWRDSGFGVIQDNEVLAWMPRPKPYQEGEQNE